MNLDISSEFRKMAIRAILTIILFIIVYLLLISSAIALMSACVVGGIGLILLKPALITIAIGLGLAGMGIFIMIFLVKFIFKKHRSDRSNLIEISKEDQPELFAIIGEIVKEVKTDFPKRVYFSPEVNAAVFYDSGFWSMFLPIRKNLMIGMGLVNAVTVDEFRAILAHEFGHFSQRSMKIGSYVYNVNKVIYNMLNENQGYENLVVRWASISGYFAFFIRIAFKIIQGIQWVLHKMYGFVNLNHLKLSREMEFHADAVAASITGSQPLITSLPRLALADHAFNTVMDFYNDRVNSAVIATNVYPQQHHVMHFVAKENELVVENNLPQLKDENIGKYNSKLIITNQWASHPGTDDRIKRLQQLNIPNLHPDNRFAREIFRNIQHLETSLTEFVFSMVTHEKEVTTTTTESFVQEFDTAIKEKTNHRIYRGYYDHKLPVHVERTEGQLDLVEPVSVDDLFSHQQVSILYICSTLETDLNSIKQIANGGYTIKTFDYDGNKYFVNDCGRLIDELENELAKLKETIRQHDILIYRSFYAMACETDQQAAFQKEWNTFIQMDKLSDEQFAVYSRLLESTGFIHRQTSLDEIEQQLKILASEEIVLKTTIRKFLKEPVYAEVITAAMRANFEAYIARPLNYFIINEYDNNNLKIFFTALYDFHTVLSKSFLRQKKSLLEFQVLLAESLEVKVA